MTKHADDATAVLDARIGVDTTTFSGTLFLLQGKAATGKKYQLMVSNKTDSEGVTLVCAACENAASDY